jgi:hypothetical protein
MMRLMYAKPCTQVWHLSDPSMLNHYSPPQGALTCRSTVLGWCSCGAVYERRDILVLQSPQHQYYK